MEICVLVGNQFYNEDSELIQIEGIKYNEDSAKTLLEKNGSKTTLKAMYSDGWALKNVMQRAHLDNHLMFFLER